MKLEYVIFQRKGKDMLHLCEEKMSEDHKNAKKDASLNSRPGRHAAHECDAACGTGPGSEVDRVVVLNDGFVTGLPVTEHRDFAELYDFHLRGSGGIICHVQRIQHYFAKGRMTVNRNS